MQPPSLLSPNGQLVSGSDSASRSECDLRVTHSSATRALPHVSECLALALLAVTALLLTYLGGSRPSTASSMVGQPGLLPRDAPAISPLSYDDLRQAALITPSQGWHAQRHAWLGQRVRWRGYVVSRQVAGAIQIDMDLPGSSILGADVTISWAKPPNQHLAIGQPITFEGEVAAVHRWGGHLWIRLDNAAYVAPPPVWKLPY
ncbi:MAG: hypothetical protein ACYC4R_03540 [Anaerolineae bacterium]